MLKWYKRIKGKVVEMMQSDCVSFRYATKADIVNINTFGIGACPFDVKFRINISTHSKWGTLWWRDPDEHYYDTDFMWGITNYGFKIQIWPHELHPV